MKDFVKSCKTFENLFLFEICETLFLVVDDLSLPYVQTIVLSIRVLWIVVHNF